MPSSVQMQAPTCGSKRPHGSGRPLPRRAEESQSHTNAMDEERTLCGKGARVEAW